MEAFILAAGLGTRLRPLTNDRPKALVCLNGQTLLEIAIGNLVSQGVDHIVVNVHHFADMMKEYINGRVWPVPVDISDESNCLLDTGGAIAHAAPLFDGHSRIVIHNVDILSDVDLTEMAAYSAQTRALATLAVSRRASSRQLLFADSMLVGWKNNKTGESLWAGDPTDSYEEMAFSGIAVVAPSLPSMLAMSYDGPFPIIPAYLRLAKHHVINSFIHDASRWMDVGRVESLSLAADFLNR